MTRGYCLALLNQQRIGLSTGSTRPLLLSKPLATMHINFLLSTCTITQCKHCWLLLKCLQYCLASASFWCIALPSLFACIAIGFAYFEQSNELFLTLTMHSKCCTIACSLIVVCELKLRWWVWWTWELELVDCGSKGGYVRIVCWCPSKMRDSSP